IDDQYNSARIAYTAKAGTDYYGSPIPAGTPWVWWLRSPGGGANYAACVGDGSMSVYGDTVDLSDDGLRPAMWVTL
ncbi:MAG: DUF6273 domain-containing protein, partial [Oscillospiraceae bacterium]|nr:DUF6273 domain-containing protein [Oscillospiraceae bacterium]